LRARPWPGLRHADLEQEGPHVTPPATDPSREQASLHASVVHCGAAKPSASRRVQAGKLTARPAPLLRLAANDPSGALATRGARWQSDGRAPREPSDLFIESGRW